MALSLTSIFQMNITIETDGSITFLGELPADLDLPLGNPIRRRVSVIQPVSPLKKVTFLFLRLVAGDTGRAAAFTRKWKGPWLCTILATGQSAVFERRDQAVAWEVGILTAQ